MDTDLRHSCPDACFFHAEVDMRHGISDATFYAWKATYGALEVSD
ncbi:MAG: hypothetical protein R3D44_16080 [Hyphomicrobiaceae bacterium]